MTGPNSIGLDPAYVRDVEVAGDDHRLGLAPHELVQVPQLVMAVAEFQREMDQEHCHIFEFELDDQLLDAGIEVMKLFTMDTIRCHERIALLAHNRQQLI